MLFPSQLLNQIHSKVHNHVSVFAACLGPHWDMFLDFISLTWILHLLKLKFKFHLCRFPKAYYNFFIACIAISLASLIFGLSAVCTFSWGTPDWRECRPVFSFRYLSWKYLSQSDKFHEGGNKEEAIGV